MSDHPEMAIDTHVTSCLQTSAHYETADLRQRLDDAHRELQRLQDEMEERQKFPKLARTLARRLLKEPLFKLTGRYRRSIHRGDHLLKTPSFKPYTLTYRRPPGSRGRPVIVHVIGNFRIGGLSRLVLDLVEWTSDCYEHVVITLHNPDPPAFLGITVLELGEKTSAKEFGRAMSQYGPALVHVHHYAPHGLHHVWLWYRNATLGAARLAVPLIEGVNVPMLPYLHPAIRSYIFVSRYVEDTFGFLNAPNRTIYPGSDFAHFAPTSGDFTDTIGMVYRLDDSKLRRESIEVFVRVLEARSSCRALIVGDGPLLSCFQQRVNDAGLGDRVEFTGYVAYEKLPKYYDRMDVFVAPIFCESFGQVTPFAMNMGIPVAAYATGALPEMLDNPEVTAPTGDAQALAGIILRMLIEPDWAAAVAARGHARATELFSVEAMIREYTKLYDTLLTE